MSSSKGSSKKVTKVSSATEVKASATTARKLKKAVAPNAAATPVGAAGSGAGGSSTTSVVSATSGSGASLSSSSALTIVSPGTIAAWVTTVGKLEAALPDVPAVGVSGKKRALKMRKGGATIAPLVVTIAGNYGITLPQLPTNEIDAQAAAVTSIGNLLTQLATVQTALANYQFALQSSMWRTTTALYTILRRLAKSDQTMANALAPVTQFFAYRTPAVRVNHPKTAKGKAAKKAKTTANASATPASPPAIAANGGTSATTAAPPMHS